jgi:hypothetical protein
MGQLLGSIFGWLRGSRAAGPQTPVFKARTRQAAGRAKGVPMVANMMVERTNMGLSGVSSMVTPTMTTTPSVPGNFLMVPRCTMKIEKCTGGIKIHCVCDDKMAASMVQNLCTMLVGGMCSCCVMMNGMQVCTVNFTMGMCRCEMTETGVCITCTSGDSQCCEMIQACGECCVVLMNNGCTCCVMMNNTPVCCGTCETTPSVAKKK